LRLLIRSSLQWPSYLRGKVKKKNYGWRGIGLYPKKKTFIETKRVEGSEKGGKKGADRRQAARIRLFNRA